MRIGLCGAHRTGKTTLATALAQTLNIKQVRSSVSAIAAEYDFDMDNHVRDDPKFFMMQKHILVSLVEAVKDEASFVSDRTPLDAAAYLLADVRANTGDAAFQEEVLRYMDKAIRATDNLFDVVILLPPAIAFEPMDGKPGGNLAYQEHHHLIVRGLMDDLTTPHGVIERENLKLGDRVESAVEFIRGVEKRRGQRIAKIAAAA